MSDVEELTVEFEVRKIKCETCEVEAETPTAAAVEIFAKQHEGHDLSYGVVITVPPKMASAPQFWMQGHHEFQQGSGRRVKYKAKK